MTAMPAGRLSCAAVAGPPSPDNPEVVPATVKMLLVAAPAGAQSSRARAAVRKRGRRMRPWCAANPTFASGAAPDLLQPVYTKLRPGCHGAGHGPLDRDRPRNHAPAPDEERARVLRRVRRHREEEGPRD